LLISKLLIFWFFYSTNSFSASLTQHSGFSILMTLFAATLAAAILLLLLGVALLWSGPVVERTLKSFPRSQAAALVFFGGSAVWFIYLLSKLGPADFGDYRNILILIFAVVGIAAFFVSRDFLAVRGVAILALLAARPMLDASLVYYPPPETRVWLNGFVYLAIVLAIYFGSLPYQARDFFLWIFDRPARARVLGVLCTAYGIGLAVLALTYHNKY
jgi:hypothetical protein